MMTHPLLFDRSLVARNRARARRIAADGADFLLRRVADDLGDRLAAILRDFDVAADFSAGAGPLVTAAIGASGKVGRVIRAGTNGDQSGAVSTGIELVLDEEALPFGTERLDLAVSAVSLQFVNDLPGALVQIRRALRPDGLFLGALIGGDSLRELRANLTEAEVHVTGGASPRVLPFVDVRDLGGLMQRAGFALPVTDVDEVVVRYDTIIDLMRDLRAMGATSALAERSRKPLRRDVLARAGQLYAARHADPDGRIRATFQVVYVLGWAPHESQQKPLKPGSAKARLADALRTVERSAGERSPGGR